MTPKTVKYSAQLRTPEGDRWFGFEGEVEPNEDPIEAFKKAQAIVHLAAGGGSMEGGPSIQHPFNREEIARLINEPKDNRIDVLIKDIQSCEVIDEVNGFGVQVGLLGFQIMAQADPRIQEAYDAQMIKLSKN